MKSKSYLSKLMNTPFEYPARQIMQKLKEMDTVPTEAISCAVAPTLVSYVLWVLDDAFKKGIRRLHFLSRDGKILKEIAEVLCIKYHLTIECRYFYCSRFVLRLPLFMIDYELAIQKFCDISERVTLEAIFLRAGILLEEQLRIQKDIGVAYGLNDYLSKQQLQELRELLSESSEFKNIILPKAATLYDKFKEYVLQEKMTGDIAIVDSGWSGSMQEGLHKIISHMKLPHRSLTGYYFGIIRMPTSPSGIYKGYYFDCRQGFKNFYRFNNNLFECFCSADHGMTIDYKRIQDSINPVFNRYTDSSHVKYLFCICKKFAVLFAENENFEDIKHSNNLKTVHRVLNSLMAKPSKEEADYFGNIVFSDDVSESYYANLASELTKEQLKSFFLSQKLKEKLLHHPKLPNLTFWAYGSIARLDAGLGLLNRLDFEALNLLKYIWAKVHK